MPAFRTSPFCGSRQRKIYANKGNGLKHTAGESRRDCRLSVADLFRLWQRPWSIIKTQSLLAPRCASLLQKKRWLRQHGLWISARRWCRCHYLLVIPASLHFPQSGVYTVYKCFKTGSRCLAGPRCQPRQRPGSFTPFSGNVSGQLYRLPRQTLRTGCQKTAVFWRRRFDSSCTSSRLLLVSRMRIPFNHFVIRGGHVGIRLRIITLFVTPGLPVFSVPVTGLPGLLDSGSMTVLSIITA